MIHFGNDGKIIEVYGYADDDGTGSLHEIRLERGDKFTVLETWIEFGEVDGKVYYVEEEGTLTFGNVSIELFDEDAYPGEYILGFIFGYIDRNWVEEYTWFFYNSSFNNIVMSDLL